MNAYALIGILGSVASIVSLLIAAPNTKSRIIHMAYGFLLTLVVGSSFIYSHNQEKELIASKAREDKLKIEIENLKSIKLRARQILDSRGYSSTSDEGKNRGFVLTVFAFLEENQKFFPESYSISKKLIIEGLKITESAGSVGSPGYYDERKRLEDGATAMASLLKGIAEQK